MGMSRTLEVALGAYAGCFAGRSVAHIASKAKVSKNSRNISIVTVAVAAAVSAPECRMRGRLSGGRCRQLEFVSKEKRKQADVIFLSYQRFNCNAQAAKEEAGRGDLLFSLFPKHHDMTSIIS